MFTLTTIVVVIVWWLDLQLPVQSVPITTKVVSSIYSIQHYVIKFVSDLRQVGGSLRFPLSIKLTCFNISEILLKVMFNTISLASPKYGINLNIYAQYIVQ